MPEHKNKTFSEVPDDVTGDSFESCTFSGAQFTQLESMTFSACRFLDCQFASAEARQVRFDHCEFYDKERETATNFKFARLHECHFHRCDLSLNDLSRSSLYLSEFHDCQLTGVNLVSATCCQAIGDKVELSAAKFLDCNMAYADLTGSRMPEADFSGCRMSHVQLDGADLTAAILTDCELHQIQADRVILKDADLRGATISGLDIRRIDVEGVRIDPAQAVLLLEAVGMIVE